MKSTLKSLPWALVIALASGCATMGSNGRPPTVAQKVAGCTGAIVAGALLGKWLGGHRDDAVRGALVGAGVCGVWLAFNNARDRQRVEQTQASALRSGQSQYQQWYGEDGRQRTVQVELVSEEVPLPDSRVSGVVCRQVKTTVSAQGAGSDDLFEEWCRRPDGSYAPRAQVST